MRTFAPSRAEVRTGRRYQHAIAAETAHAFTGLLVGMGLAALIWALLALVIWVSIAPAAAGVIVDMQRRDAHGGVQHIACQLDAVPAAVLYRASRSGHVLSVRCHGAADLIFGDGFEARP